MPITAQKVEKHWIKEHSLNLYLNPYVIPCFASHPLCWMLPPIDINCGRNFRGTISCLPNRVHVIVREGWKFVLYEKAMGRFLLEFSYRNYIDYWLKQTTFDKKKKLRKKCVPMWASKDKGETGLFCYLRIKGFGKKRSRGD